MNKETLGPAERLIQTLLAYSGHMVHNRPGVVRPDPTSPVRIRWDYVCYKEENGKRVVYLLTSKRQRVAIGTLGADGSVRADDRRKIGEYRKPGILAEVAIWMYRQVAEVWRLDNELAARWASYSFSGEHRDLKTVLAAFMLVQSRKGDPIREGGELVFHDDDYRNVGEAMVLLQRKDKRDLSPKLLLRVHDILCLPEIAEINRELGFGRSARKPFLGRWPKAVTRWLRFREENPPLLQGLVKAGYASTVKRLACHVGYKPSSPHFFEILRWRQDQAKDGRRSIAIGAEVAKAETWEGLSEMEICQRIVAERPRIKKLTGLLPKNTGFTRAIVAAAIEAGSFSDKDLIIYSPTLEELGLLKVQDIRERWERALKTAEDMRAANVAARMRSKEVKEKLEQAADKAVQKVVEKVTRNLRIYLFVDISSSMTSAIEKAKSYLEKLIHAFPPEKLHVAVFNTAGREIKVKHRSAAGVRQAFRGISAGGGTSYVAGVRALRGYKPTADEDALFLFVGDEEDFSGPQLAKAVEDTGIAPVAFGLVKVRQSAYRIVQDAAQALQIPCFMLKEEIFSDPYEVPRALGRLIESTPVGEKLQQRTAQARIPLVDQIIQTKLLQKPLWAA